MDEMNYKGSKYNADVHRALDIMNKFEKSQTVDEAPASFMSRVGDAAKGMVPGGMGRMAKGRLASGHQANAINKQWQTFLGQKGHKNQKTATIGDLGEFLGKFQIDPAPYYQKAGVSAGDPGTVITKKQQDAIMLQVGQSLTAAGGQQDPNAKQGTQATGTQAAAGGTAAKTASAGASVAAQQFGGTSTAKPKSGTSTATGGAGGAAGAGGAGGAGGTATATGGAGGAGGAGATGATGATGTGTAGPAGPAGADGAAGEPGEPGTPGADGAAGEPGAPGADGAAGEPGTPGADGAAGEPETPGEPEAPATPAQKFNNGDEISYINAKGKAQDGIFVQYLDTKDAQGDPQAQVRQPNQTDAQAYAIDADNIGPKGSPPVNNDVAKASTPAQNEVVAQVAKLSDQDRVKLKNTIGQILTRQAAKASNTGVAA